MRRLVLLVSVIVLVDTMLYAALTPLLPEYSEEFGLSKSGAGVLVAIYAVGVLVGAFPAGFAAARYGAKPAALTGLVVVGVASVGFAFADDVWTLGVSRFVQGLGSALSWAGGLSWLIAASERGRRGQLLGTALSAAIFGALLGPLIGGVASVAGARLTFTVIGALAVLVAVAGLREPGVPCEKPSLAAIGHAFRERRFVGGLWLMLLPALLFGILAVLASLDLDRLRLERGRDRGALLHHGRTRDVREPVDRPPGRSPRRLDAGAHRASRRCRRRARSRLGEPAVADRGALALSPRSPGAPSSRRE